MLLKFDIHNATLQSYLTEDYSESKDHTLLNPSIIAGFKCSYHKVIFICKLIM